VASDTKPLDERRNTIEFTNGTVEIVVEYWSGLAAAQVDNKVWVGLDSILSGMLQQCSGLNQLNEYIATNEPPMGTTRSEAERVTRVEDQVIRARVFVEIARDIPSFQLGCVTEPMLEGVGGLMVIALDDEGYMEYMASRQNRGGLLAALSAHNHGYHHDHASENRHSGTGQYL